jgi:5-(carboxyamino)imidazole ribonucleotide mutase
MDALLSTVQMPSGVPVATVAINGAENAAILAMQILAIGNERILNELTLMRNELRNL